MRQDSQMVDDSMLRRLNKQNSETTAESALAVVEEIKEETKE